MIETVGYGAIAELNCEEHPCIGVITFEDTEDAGPFVEDYIALTADTFGSPILMGQASWNDRGGYVVLPLAAATDEIEWLRRLHHRMAVEDEVFAHELQEAR